MYVKDFAIECLSELAAQRKVVYVRNHVVVQLRRIRIRTQIWIREHSQARSAPFRRKAHIMAIEVSHEQTDSAVSRRTFVALRSILLITTHTVNANKPSDRRLVAMAPRH